MPDEPYRLDSTCKMHTYFSTGISIMYFTIRKHVCHNSIYFSGDPFKGNGFSSDPFGAEDPFKSSFGDTSTSSKVNIG